MSVGLSFACAVLMSLGLSGFSDADAACTANPKQAPAEAGENSTDANAVGTRHKSSATVSAGSAGKGGSSEESPDPRARWHRYLPGMIK
ncbi:MAG: hypothetical protein ACT4NL_00470 [Pseudomarimonas sp.]